VSANRTRNRTTPRFTLILASSAFALAAVAAGAVTAGGTATLPSGAHAGPASAVSAAGPGSPASAGSVADSGSGGQAIALDAFAQPSRRSDAAAARRLSPRQIAWSLLKSHGWTTGQFGYLNLLWIRESGWNPYASNPYSGAYGIPQALPGSKMASAGPAWRTNPRTQILWGMHYIKVRYHTPYGAWRHELIYGWY
jgi:resuscitation-promoting factor RpfB